MGMANRPVEPGELEATSRIVAESHVGPHGVDRDRRSGCGLAQVNDLHLWSGRGDRRV